MSPYTNREKLNAEYTNASCSPATSTRKKLKEKTSISNNTYMKSKADQGVFEQFPASEKLHLHQGRFLRAVAGEPKHRAHQSLPKVLPGAVQRAPLPHAHEQSHPPELLKYAALLQRNRHRHYSSVRTHLDLNVENGRADPRPFLLDL